MKNRMVKVQTILLAIVCILSTIGMIPLNVYAADSTSTEPIEVKTVCLNSNKFEFDDNSGYNFESKSELGQYSRGNELDVYRSYSVGINNKEFFTGISGRILAAAILF